MRRHSLVAASAVLVLTGALVLVGRPASAQTPSGARTPWGDPDLQGVWNFSTPTPLERPAEFAGREVLTDAEIAALADEAASRDRRSATAEQDVRQAYNEFWSERGQPTRRTSLILDPADGKLPPLTAAGQQRAATAAQRGYDSWTNRSLWERCVTRSGLPRIPGSYNNNVQIFQSPGYVVLLYEMIHETRIIPVDGRSHLGPGLRQWLGDSRGRWEGDTLVVSTRNFNEKASVRGTSANLRLTERFTRTGAGTIDYQFTVEDPDSFTRPWTAGLPMTRLSEMIYEYACHEHNHGMTNLLNGARAQERASAGTRPGSR